MTEPTAIKARGDGIGINLFEWPGEGRPILAVHGLTANGRCWFSVARALAPARRLLGLDLRGRGLSDAPPTGYSAARHVADIVAVLDDLGLDRVGVMGHSLGAFISLALAARHPDRVERIALFDAGAALSPEEWGRVAAAIQPAVDRLGRVFATPDELIDLLGQNPDLQPFTPEIEAWYRWGLVEVEGGFVDRVRPEPIAEERANVVTSDPATLYPDIRCPVLVLRATEGFGPTRALVLPAPATAALVGALADARAVDVPGSNHYTIVFHDQPVRDRALAEFFRE